ncbi:DUF4347 domain-containing protein, partial [Methyloglobulus sp.]|uniref:DUF4347 domain-containing protein n=1 Tax=Methyloglobulus sp. TaxID=2518622 RepID=UPI0032B85499
MKKKSNNLPKSNKKASASSMRLALENRLLFDGAIVATATEVVDDKAAQDQQASKDIKPDSVPDAGVESGDAHVTFGSFMDAERVVQQPLAITSAASAGNSDAPTLFVVDSRAEGLHELLTNPPANTQIKVLDTGRDGYQQIAEILQDRGNTTNLHVLTADLGGKQWLGSSQITSNITAINSSNLVDWGDGLVADANIVFHGRELINNSWLTHVNALTGGQASWTRDSAVEVNKAATTETSVITKETKPSDQHEKTPAAVANVETHTVKSLIFVDSTVADYQVLLKDIDSNSTVILLDPNKDGVEQIAKIVSQYDNIDAIHIISHGNAGHLNLGSSVLDKTNMQGQYADQLALISRHLSTNADILVYGCNFGEGEIGGRAANTLAILTGADVASSTDLTGSSDQGGDWDLEARTGAIEALGIEAPLWAGLLAKTNTGQWAVAGAAPTQTATNTTDGVVTTVTLKDGTSGWTGVAGGAGITLNNILAFDNNAQGGPSLTTIFDAGAARGSATITFSFSVPVTNPIIHIDRLGGVLDPDGAGPLPGRSTSAQLTLTSGGTLVKLTGPSHFVVSGTTINRTLDQVVASNGESSLTGTLGTAAGSVQVTGTFSSVSFRLDDMVNLTPGIGWTGDGIEFAVAVDAPPVAQNDAFTIAEDASLSGNLYANNGSGVDSDIRGDTMTINRINNAVYTVGGPIALANGTLTITNATTGAFTFVPNADFNGTQAFTYTITDANGGTSTATSTITVTPVADIVPDTLTFNEGGSITYNPITGTNGASADNFEGTTPQITKIANTNIAVGGSVAVLNGTVTLAAGNLLTFTPTNPDFNGTTTYTYTVLSGGVTETATETINVTAVNDAPTVTMPAPLTGFEDTSLTVTGISFADIDAGNNGIQVTLNIPVGRGTLSWTGAPFTGVDPTSTSTNLVLNGSYAAITNAIANNALRFIPAPDFNTSISGPITLTAYINDNGNTGTGGPITTSATTTITVTPVADIVADNLTTNANTPLIYNPIAGTNGASIDNFENTPAITAINGIAVSVGVPVTVANGTVTLSAGNILTFTPTTNFTGTTTYEYTVTSGGVTETAAETITIPPQININDISFNEAAGTATFAVTLSSASSQVVTVGYSTANGTAIAGSDYTAATGTLTFAAGITTQFVTVSITDDTVYEGAIGETFNVNLSGATNATIADALGIGTITDNDGTPTLSLTGPAAVNEAAGTLTYTVTLSNPSASAVTVNYTTTDGTAVAGSDYTASTGSLTFAAGETSKTITVAITDDSVYEGPESFSVDLSGPTNATITTGTVATTINDDGTGSLPNGGTATDDRPQVGSVSSPTVVEGTGLDFTVTLTHASTTATTVTLAPASGTATLGTDTGALLVSFDNGATFVPVVGSSVLVPIGATSFIVRIPTVDDGTSEPSETLTLGASTAQNASPVTGLGTITDNDGTPTLSLTGPAVVNEAAGTLTYTVTLSNPSASAVTVNYTTTDGTA